MAVEFVVVPPRIFLVLLAVVLLIVLLSMFLKRGSIARKMIAMRFSGLWPSFSIAPPSWRSTSRDLP
jgi:hypothetical protein